MDSSNEKLREMIQRLDTTASSTMSPKDAERLMSEILEPLLAKEDYLLQAVNQRRDLGVDFIASKAHLGQLDADDIAIEYKHFHQNAVGVNAIHQVLGAAMSMGLSRAMLVTNSKFTYSAREAIRRDSPVSIELVDIDALRSWIGRIEEVPSIDLTQINLIRCELSRKFIELIVKNPRYLDEIEWREMERLLTEIFEGLGFEARLTPGSKDGGKDIMLECRVKAESHTYYVEVKHWRSRQRVGSGSIKEFLNVLVNEEVDGGLYLSTYGFCSNAIESLTEVQRKTLRFGTENKVVSLCKSYVKATSGIWSPDRALPEMLFDNTL